MGYYQSQNDQEKGNIQLQSSLPLHMGGGKYPTPAHTTHSTPTKGVGKKTETLLLSSQSRSTGSFKDWELITGLQNSSLSPTSYNQIIKDLFPFTQYIMSGYQEKITRHTKRQKTQFEVTEQASEPNMAGMLELHD